MPDSPIPTVTDRVKSAEVYRVVFEGAVDGIVLIRDGRFIDANPKATEIFRLSRDELIGLTIGEVSPKVQPDGRDSRESAEEKVRAVLAGTPQCFEWRHLRADHTSIDVEMHVSRVELEGGHCVLGVIRDISALKEAREELKLDEARLETLIRLSQMQNKSVKEITDYALEEGVRLTRSEFGYLAFLNDDESVLNMYSWSQEAMKQCRVEAVTTYYPVASTGLWGEAVRMRRPVITNDYHAPNPFKKGVPPGHIRLRRHMNVPVFEGDRIVALAGVGNKQAPYDESDVRQLTLMMDGMWKVIQQQRRRVFIETVLENLPVGINVASLAAERSTYMNRRFIEICGWPAEVVQDRQPFFSAVFPDPEYRSEMEHLYQEQIRNAKSGRLRWDLARFQTFQGEERIVSTGGFKVPGDDLLIFMIEDVTERVRAEEERRKLESQMQYAQKLESIGVLAGGIAHDFNNILMSVLGNADLALSDIPLEAPVRTYLTEIEKAAHRAADLCRQMLAYSGRGAFNIHPINLRDTIEEMTAMLRVSVSKNISLEFDFGERLPLVMADAAQIRQVLVNLVSNASDAMGDANGVISLRVCTIDCDEMYLHDVYIDEHLEPGCYVSMEVSDAGCGMDADTKERIFEPFFTTKFTGRGLGMAAVLGIVRSHKGAIRVYSEPGRGTTVRIILPALGEEVRVSPIVGAKPANREARNTVLLVDDEEPIRLLTAKMLERAGYRAITAVDGNDALRLFRAHAEEIDCVVLDLTMPNMNGEEAFNHLRVLSSDVPIIISSGYNEQEVAQRFAGTSVSGFIQKPYASAVLCEQVACALGAGQSGGADAERGKQG